ncbi:MFS transporter [Labedaea rhizosphaerae]|uniref:Sugar phosphate permease n=1 Tax=Labedaea rhizosphaerae TaxID=598644 RepID=A0A4R6SP08_LABRH|nr:MFS transporter [Labedaea rhizosphaerae]TDQ05310.1 sugar phosphate permease [Labedaea rhizosphaerae]
MGGRRWWILGVAVLAQATVSAFTYGLPFVLPQLQADEHLSLTGASTVAVTPVLGLLAGLIAWGAAADRYGERIVLTSGMVGTGAFGLLALACHQLVLLGACLALGGLFSAAISAASGRAVLGWFSVKERGLAMGIRQTCTPLGIGLASLTMPPLAAHHGFRAAIAFPAILSLAVAVLVVTIVIDPPRPPAKTVEHTRSPYRHATLWRVHAASALLVAPQFFASTFALTYLVSRWHWSPVATGQVLAAVAVAAAGGRIAAGIWSDRVGSRMRPMRMIAVAAVLVVLAWALGDWLGWWLAVVALVAALIVTVTDNGLGFVATAEMAGPYWAGRALGVQNTGQNAVALLTPPMFAALITAYGYPIALLVCALFPLAGVALIPVRSESLEPLAVTRT